MKWFKAILWYRVPGHRHDRSDRLWPRVKSRSMKGTGEKPPLPAGHAAAAKGMNKPPAAERMIPA